MTKIFPLTLRWSGDTAVPGYTHNSEAGTAGKPALHLSSAAAPGGDETRWNPEDLLGASLAQCHLLTFLALCAKAKVTILAYEDQAEVVLDTVNKVTSVVEIRLHPTITIAPGADPATAAVSPALWARLARVSRTPERVAA